MMKKYLLATVALFTVFGAFAQNQEKCGTDIILQQQLQDPKTRAQYDAFQEAVQRYTADPQVAVSRNESGVRIIPVVFHILHDGGNENISLTKVQQQMDVLNADYRRLNSDTVNTPQRFYGDTEYTHFVFNSDSIASFVDDSSYVNLHNRLGESFAFHFNNGTGGLADTLIPNFDNVIEISISNNADTAAIAQAFAQAVNAQNGLNAEYVHESVFAQVPNFTVDGATVPSLNYTSEHTFTTSWNGVDTDTTWSDTLTVVLFENAQNPSAPTDTLYVFSADVTYDVFDGSGNVVSIESFVSEGSLTLQLTQITIVYANYRVNVSTDGLGYTDDVLVGGLWGVTSTIDQQGTYIPADCNIEFRLATKDPLGNCTDGVVRVFTSKTNGANDGTGFKAESYWNAYSYLNIWSVGNIALSIDGGGTVLGYAQFPATGLLSTDGITVLASNINTANNGGRTATHEVGHWLSLIHMWGDSDCGSDNVFDTPTAQAPNYNVCGNVGSPLHTQPYKLHVCDPNNPDGEMFNNYMDYSSDFCMNIFTRGQKARMDFTFNGDGNEPGYRAFLISQENLELTGTADPYTVPECAPISGFHFDQSGDFATQKMICVGENVDFEEGAFNGQVDDYAWTFEGGNPGASTTANPSNISYDNPGIFDVSLQVTNGFGSHTKTANDMIIVSPSTAQFQSSWGYVESFWNEQDFLDDYVVFNQDQANNKWEWYKGPNAGSTGWESVRMNNVFNGGGEIDELISPSYDLSTIDSPTLKFRYSGAASNNNPQDELRIMLSDNCGATWQTRETLSDFELTNAGLSPSSYVPSANSTWTDFSVALGSFANKPNVRVKFRWIAGEKRSNNFYIDDITISNSPLGMEEIENLIDLNVAPNPTVGLTTVSMNLPDDANVKMEIIDVLGKNVNPLFSRNMSNGAHRFDVDMSNYSVGVYYLRILVDNDMIMKKIVKN